MASTFTGKVLIRWLVPVLLALEGCWPADPTASLLNRATDESTASEMRQSFGVPHTIVPLDDGGERWVYHFEGDRYAWGGKAHRCVEYVLIFDNRQILTDWDRDEC